jgi:hypothetical protein
VTRPTLCDLPSFDAGIAGRICHTPFSCRYATATASRRYIRRLLAFRQRELEARMRMSRRRLVTYAGLPVAALIAAGTGLQLAAASSHQPPARFEASTSRASSPSHRPTLAPAPSPSPHRPTPAPSPSPTRPAPSPSPACHRPRPDPSPSPGSARHRSTPAPSPSPAPSCRRPTPSPSPYPTPSDHRPAPVPSPAPSPSPSRHRRTPAPVPSPAGRSSR